MGFLFVPIIVALIVPPSSIFVLLVFVIETPLFNLAILLQKERKYDEAIETSLIHASLVLKKIFWETTDLHTI